MPLALIAVVLAGAAIAGILRRLVRVSLLLTLPIAISVILVSALTRPGETVLLMLGPFDVTLEGLDFAGQTLVRAVRDLDRDRPLHADDRSRERSSSTWSGAGSRLASRSPLPQRSRPSPRWRAGPG